LCYAPAQSAKATADFSADWTFFREQGHTSSTTLAFETQRDAAEERSTQSSQKARKSQFF
jgi:hypothetical protein